MYIPLLGNLSYHNLDEGGTQVDPKNVIEGKAVTHFGFIISHSYTLLGFFPCILVESHVLFSRLDMRSPAILLSPVLSWMLLVNRRAALYL